MPKPIPRSLEAQIEIAVTRWTESLMEQQGLSREQASVTALRLLRELATGECIVTKNPFHGKETR